MREGSKNGNWKGGITKFRSADELLSSPKQVQQEVKSRLLAKVEEDFSTNCWNWTGNTFKCNGRARMILGTSFLASRISYVLFKGGTNGLCVLHSCDNVLCVNPEHLWLGTNADNSADMVRKGRTPLQDGSLNPGAILNEVLVSAIKVKLRSGHKQNKLAMEYGVCKQVINNIAHGKSWRHVP